LSWAVLFIFISWLTFTLLSPALWRRWDNGSNRPTTVQSRRLHSMSQTRFARYLAVWTVVVTRQRACDECLDSVNCGPYHSIAKHCKMNTLSVTEHHAALTVAKILFSKRLCISDIQRNIKICTEISFYASRAFKPASCPELRVWWPLAKATCLQLLHGQSETYILHG